MQCENAPGLLLWGILQPSGVRALSNANDTLAGNYRPRRLQLYETRLCMQARTDASVCVTQAMKSDVDRRRNISV